MKRASLRVARLERGSALVLAMIILLVLALIAAGALRLAFQESTSVNRRYKYQLLQACADAAQQKLLADYALYTNAAWKPVVVPGSAVDVTPGHFDSDIQYSGGVLQPPVNVSSVSLTSGSPPAAESLPPNSMSGGLGVVDSTNRQSKQLGGQPYLVVAHCTDTSTGVPREYEVELMVRLGL